MQQIGLNPTPSKVQSKRVTLTNGTEFPLTGLCVYFVRPNNSKAVSTSNIVEVSSLSLVHIEIFSWLSRR